MKKLIGIIMFTALLMTSLPAMAQQQDRLKAIKLRMDALDKKEQALKLEEKRIKEIGREIDEKIIEYSKILKNLELALKKLERARKGSLKQLVKTYEAMPSEEAAEKLQALPEETAVIIINGMNSRKAGAAMALMDAEKVAELTYAIERIVKNIPSR